MNEYSKIKYKVFNKGKLKSVSYSQITNYYKEFEITNGVTIKDKILYKIYRDIRFYRDCNKTADKVEVYVDNVLFTIIDLKQSKMKIKKLIKEAML